MGSFAISIGADKQDVRVVKACQYIRIYIWESPALFHHRHRCNTELSRCPWLNTFLIHLSLSFQEFCTNESRLLRARGHGPHWPDRSVAAYRQWTVDPGSCASGRLHGPWHFHWVNANGAILKAKRQFIQGGMDGAFHMVDMTIQVCKITTRRCKMWPDGYLARQISMGTSPAKAPP